MAFPQGINFRATAGYVTDGTGEDHETAVSTYPRTSAQGNTVGFEDANIAFFRDRNNLADRRLAGIAAPNGAKSTYRIDLPATGAYDIRLAAGDDTNANPCNTELFDTTTSLGALTSGSVTAGNFHDATDTNYSDANWPGSNTAVSKTFSTTILRLKIGNGSDTSVVAHINVAAGAAPTGGPFPMFTPPLTGGMRVLSAGMQG